MLRLMKNKIFSINSMQYFLLLFCAVFLIVAGIGNTFAYVMTKTPTLINSFLNGLSPDGDLVLQKTVSHPYGDLYTIPSDLVFAFEVNLGTEYANQTVKTTQGELVANENGIVTVTVAPGGRTTIYDVDEETVVSVTETLIGTGFTPDSVSKNLTIQKYQDNILTFTNTYTPAVADNSSLVVSGSKTLVGREWIEGDNFTFALEVRENGEWKSLGIQTVTYELVEQSDPADPEKTIKVPKTDFDKFDFTELIHSYSFANTGSYSFRVSEIEGSIGGVTYDKTESKFDVFVGDADMDGYLEIQAITTASANTIVEGTTVSIGFENNYAPIGSTEAFIEIQKNMEDTSGQNKSTAGYTFELYDSADNLLLTSDPTGTTGETSIRLVYEPTDAGKTFDYVLKESRCGETVGALTYDATTYPLKVTVVDNLDGTVSAYIYDSDVVWDIDVTTDDAGNEGSSTVSDGDAGSNINETEPVSGGTEEDEINTSENVSDGEVENSAVDESTTSDEETENTSAVTDNTSGESDITASLGDDNTSTQEDENAQNDIESVSDNGADNLTDTFNTVSGGDAGTAVVSDEDNKTDTTASIKTGKRVSVPAGLTNTIQKTFINHYDPVDASVSISGTKTLTGRGMNPEEFVFQMYQTDSLYVITEGAQPIRTAVNSTDEVFYFDALSFDKVGTSYYVVKEDASAALGGITYDTSSYLVKIVVTDNEGVLNGSVSVINAYGTDCDIAFHNTYKALPVHLPLSVRMTLNGAALQEEAFRFQLFVADENFTAQGNAVQMVTNTQTGEVYFETLTFREAGIYRYVITELAGTMEGMTYDSSKYCLLIRVTDPGDGQLVIHEYAVTKDGQLVSEMIFENTYKEPEKPDEPDNPDEPDKPDEPDEPDKPNPPDEPITPDEPTKPEEPTDTENPDKPLPPKTGDDSNVLLYSILMIVSGCLLLLLLVFVRRRDDKE